MQAVGESELSFRAREMGWRHKSGVKVCGRRDSHGDECEGCEGKAERGFEDF
jgi:hypothetical protein